MALDGKLLARARSALEEKRRRNDEIHERRLQQVYSHVPRIRALDLEIKATMSKLIDATFSVNNDARVEEIRQQNLQLQDEWRFELMRAGYPDNYLDDEYMCPRCHDTGYVLNEMCDCLMEIYKNEQRESLSSLFKLGDETFDSFDLSYYSDMPAPDTGISPRRSMEIIYETCVEYARKFGGKSMNLFFNGAPGLGKTFLSACIARVVSENGYSVVYDMATSIFAKYKEVEFSRTDDTEEARAEIRRCLECDLLILDDLGTEMTNTFTITALYELINTRLVTGKKTIVSSNLTLNELNRRYSEQIMSRLQGEYQVLTFRGDDIRRIRNSLFS